MQWFKQRWQLQPKALSEGLDYLPIQHRKV